MTGQRAGRPILVLGSTGQIGYELLRALSALGPICGVSRAALDLTDSDAMCTMVRAMNPIAILNAAAYTAVDKAETEPDLAMQINGIAPGVLAELAAASGACFVHYSTDYVFDGRVPLPYQESSIPAPLNVYGRTKLAGERAVLAVDGAGVVLRTCWVYGTRGRNFLLTMQRLARERSKLRVVNDQQGSPTWSRFIAEATAAVLVSCGMSAARLYERRGLYHLAAAGSTSWHGFARVIIDKLANCQAVEVEAISSTEYPTLAQRPAYSVLDTTRICQTFGLHMPEWSTLLSYAMSELPSF